ncbi:adenosine deaminase-like protein [Pterulicium gracile]|uniref:Adenosine deaminase-like protein n=1 Tax=Pterulicium gracile TaxID=1884261 RepID=A0A5C3R086_9AGAR|nr:adenosine deaminase-like protein [Pterula gracilis]
MTIAGPAAEALASLSPSEISFLECLPKSELHAHLNGSISIKALQELAQSHGPEGDQTIKSKISEFASGVTLSKIDDFFTLFPAIYALTSSPKPLAIATADVLSSFLGPVERPNPQSYLELRSTPRKQPSFDGSRLEYVQTVLSVVELYPATSCAFIVSIDRRMSEEDIKECVDIAIQMKQQGRRVVGLDLCGDPLVGDMELFKPYFQRAKQHGLGITLHIAETKDNSEHDTNLLMSFEPDRLGHATFLDESSRKMVLEKKTPVELCLTSNLLCKTVPTLNDHHIRFYLDNKAPIVICTDDKLPFRTTVLGEYALLLAKSPLGLGLSEQEVKEIAEMGMQARFGVTPSA